MHYVSNVNNGSKPESIFSEVAKHYPTLFLYYPPWLVVDELERSCSYTAAQDNRQHQHIVTNILYQPIHTITCMYVQSINNLNP